MRPSLPHPAPNERGFILVGVVTFMLALTILGLSLFALSSYEAQFFVATAAREQSLQNSESGMELVKSLLGQQNARLEFAHSAEGQLGVTRALAYQWRSGLITDTTSRGPVNWDSTVVIVVTAKSGGVERTLQSRFIPTAAENPYQRLLAAGHGVRVNTENPPSASTLAITGRVWQPVASDADTAWTGVVGWSTGRPVQPGTPPTPLTNAFVSQHIGTALPPTSGPDHTNSGTGNGSYSLRLVGSPGGTFFKSAASPTSMNEDPDMLQRYTFYVGGDLHLKVQDVAIWVIPAGVCFKDRVMIEHVDPARTGTLVIVAEPNGRDPGVEDRGIWFQGGLDVADNALKVYLVSRGDVSVIQHNDITNSNDARTVSIVAGGRIEIGGPRSGTFRLGYDAASMDALADRLVGALPELSGGSGARLVAIRQSWLETTPR